MKKLNLTGSHSEYMKSGFSRSVRSSHLQQLARIPNPNPVKNKEKNLLLIFQSNIVRTRLEFCFPAILLTVPPPDKAHNANRHAEADYDGNLGGDVARGIFGAESLWALASLVRVR